MQAQSIMRPCAHCGALFHPARSQDQSRFCTRICAAQSRRVFPDRPCENCGESFQPVEARTRYCSRRCKGQGASNAARDRFAAWLQSVAGSDGCWLPPRTGDRAPYGRVSRTSTHHLAWEWASSAPVPAGRFVCHTCDTPWCVRNDDAGTYELDGLSYPRFGHLWLGDAASNMTDRKLKGRAPHGEAHVLHQQPERLPRGEAHCMTRLTETQVREVHQALAAGVYQRVIAATLGVSPSTISHIARGKTWRHIR